MAIDGPLLRFKDALLMPEALIIEEARHQDPPVAESESMVLGLRGGATILCVSAFEVFVRELFDAEVARLVAPSMAEKHELLPMKIRKHNLYSTLQSITRKPKGDESWSQEAAIPDVMRLAGMVASGVLIPASFTDTRANPNGDTVKELFGNVNLPDVFGVIRGDFETRWGQVEANTYIKDKLDEIVGRRNVVVHRNDVRLVSRDWLGEVPLFLVALAESLSAALASHIDTLIAACATPVAAGP